MKMKRFLASLLFITLIFTIMATAAFAADVQFYTAREIQNDPGILENRTPETIVVEKIFGIKQNSYGDGRILNVDTEYNYIWYDSRFDPGDLILTLDVFNPYSRYTDDVVERMDFKLGSLQDLRHASDEYIRTFSDLPKWAKPEMREILDMEFINGGTPYDDNPDDICMYMSDVRTTIISYRMFKSMG